MGRGAFAVAALNQCVLWSEGRNVRVADLGKGKGAPAWERGSAHDPSVLRN